MSSVAPDPGSFRDPGSRIYLDGGRVLRAVYPASAKDYEAFRDSGLLARLIADGRLLNSEEIGTANSPDPDAAYTLEHPRLDFISYPYEWPFALLKSSALLQLDLLLAALDDGFTMSDATAYNVQFVGTDPVFIDHLSFRPYRDGEIWAGHRQFCMQFLNPIFLWSRFGVPPNSWFRGSLEGIEPEQLAPLLRLRDRLSWTALTHIALQASLQKRANSGGGGDTPARQAKLSRTSFRGVLSGLRSFIAKAEPPGGRTVWDRYANANSYGAEEAEAKRSFVRRMAEAVKPGLLFDLGCNTGDYSIAAIEAGARRAVGFDFDFGALDQAVQRSQGSKLPFLPLWLDATNPSPDQGWAQRERGGFDRRVRGDAIFALAFIHHIAIARNVPLPMVIDWIMAIAPAGVIEFPPKSDPMVQRLLRNRPDIFPDYDEAHFIAAVEARGRIVEKQHLSKGGRLLIWYDRSN